ncbi:Slam-dependent surface lipoprotein [Neisseria sp. 74A18]|uniref:Slam-dependent surface lipoprotein n=1 Tax=Neisseria sp. 74A18 TaxID=1696094 RepID=UPI00350FBA84
MSETAFQTASNTGAWQLIPKMPDHSHLGRLSYAKAGNHDVYFGDWANVPSGAKADTAGTNYTVFYSGTGKTAKMPTSGKATYAVKGINNHVKQGTAVLTGNLTADFGTKKLNGTIARKDLSIAINNATINTAQASFGGKGTAKANNSVVGETKGHFFGNQAAALAGVADFGKNHKFNTAFGGTKK